jgi:hypothetical protein
MSVKCTVPTTRQVTNTSIYPIYQTCAGVFLQILAFHWGFMTETNSVILWKERWIFGIYKTLKISWLVEEQLILLLGMLQSRVYDTHSPMTNCVLFMKLQASSPPSQDSAFLLHFEPPNEYQSFNIRILLRSSNFHPEIILAVLSLASYKSDDNHFNNYSAASFHTI